MTRIGRAAGLVLSAAVAALAIAAPWLTPFEPGSQAVDFVYAPPVAKLRRLLEARGAAAWDQRTYVTGARKLMVMSYALAKLACSAPARLAEPWRPGALNTVWEYSKVVST